MKEKKDLVESELIEIRTKGNEIEASFNSFDKNRDGLIDVLEFRRVLELDDTLTD